MTRIGEIYRTALGWHRPSIEHYPLDACRTLAEAEDALRHYGMTGYVFSTADSEKTEARDL